MPAKLVPITLEMDDWLSGWKRHLDTQDALLAQAPSPPYQGVQVRGTQTVTHRFRSDDSTQSPPPSPQVPVSAPTCAEQTDLPVIHVGSYMSVGTDVAIASGCFAEDSNIPGNHTSFTVTDIGINGAYTISPSFNPQTGPGMMWTSYTVAGCPGGPPFDMGEGQISVGIACYPASMGGNPYAVDAWGIELGISAEIFLDSETSRIVQSISGPTFIPIGFTGPTNIATWTSLSGPVLASGGTIELT